MLAGSCPTLHQIGGFVTVQTSIVQRAHHLQYQQSFALEQGQQNVVRANNAIVNIHGYVGQDPMALDRATFMENIFHPGGYEIPCIIAAPAYGATGAILEDSALYDDARNQWMRKNKANLWLLLLNVCSPDYTTDPTAAVRELRQG